MFTKSKFRFAIMLFAVVAAVCGTAFAQPERAPRSFAEIAKKVEPAVVSIDTKSKVSQPVSKGAATPSDSDDIMDFFRRQLPQQPVYTVGSGFVVDKSAVKAAVAT